MIRYRQSKNTAFLELATQSAERHLAARLPDEPSPEKPAAKKKVAPPPPKKPAKKKEVDVLGISGDLFTDSDDGGFGGISMKPVMPPPKPPKSPKPAPPPPATPNGPLIMPGPLGDVIWLLLDVHEVTKDARYLAGAERIAALAQRTLMDDTSALPKASTWNDHYETITRCDTLMMALLRLWAVKNGKETELDLVYTDIGS
jgi:hypothetical protein